MSPRRLACRGYGVKKSKALRSAVSLAPTFCVCVRIWPDSQGVRR
jgi:hypothetical protein